MREIKFRGKRVDNGEWVCGSMLTFTNKMASITPSYTKVFKASNEVMTIKNIYDVDPATVGQYTGLHDKNGVAIFEGDIVRVKWTVKYVSADKPDEEHVANAVVYWNDFRASFALEISEYANNDLFGYVRDKVAEVIGNVHDNPELLERNT